MVLSNNTFFMFNKSHVHVQARIAQWGTNGRDVGTYAGETHDDSQLWFLNPGNYPGYYYIENIRQPSYRLAKWGNKDGDVGVYNGDYSDDQLWKFEREKDYYRIFNYKYKNAKIAKWGASDGDWGTIDGPNCDDMLWRLIPRFTSTISEHTVWACDNRKGTEPFSEEVQVKEGITITTGTSFTFNHVERQSVSAAVEFGLEKSSSVEDTTEIKREFESTLDICKTKEKKEEWSRQSTIKFTAPPGKNYRVYQISAEVESPFIPDENFLIFNCTSPA